MGTMGTRGATSQELTAGDAGTTGMRARRFHLDQPATAPRRGPPRADSGLVPTPPSVATKHPMHVFDLIDE
jgi:hypothetical protein